MTYIQPNWTAVNSVVDSLSFANDSTGGYFWFGMVVMVGLIIFVTLSSISVEIGLMTAGFICLVMSLLLVYMNLMSFQLMGVFIAVIIISIIYTTWNRRT